MLGNQFSKYHSKYKAVQDFKIDNQVNVYYTVFFYTHSNFEVYLTEDKKMSL